MGAVKGKSSGGGIAMVTGYQGTQSIQTPGAAGTTLSTAVPQSGSPIALLAANFDEPSLYTVSFNVGDASVLPIGTPSPVWPPRTPDGTQPPIPTIPQPVGNASGTRCIAILQFALEGVTVRRVIDVGSGTSISQVAQAINVFLQDMTWTVGGPGGALYSISAVISKGTRPATSLPPILWQPSVPPTALPTVSSFTIPPLGSIIVPTPQDCGITSLEVTVVDITDSTVQPVFLNVTEFTNGTPVKFYSPVTEPGFVKVNPGVNNIRLGNNSATDTVECTMTYGIDG